MGGRAIAAGVPKVSDGGGTERRRPFLLVLRRITVRGEEEEVNQVGWRNACEEHMAQDRSDLMMGRGIVSDGVFS